jgi:hypothetical protein
VILSSLARTGIIRGGDDLIGLGFVLSIALGGIVIGLVLWPALPSPAPDLGIWLLTHVAATSLGWLAAWLIAGSAPFARLGWTALVLGPLVYALITGGMMVWIERRRLAAAPAAS